MARFRHFHRNVGGWGVVRTFGVAALFLFIAVQTLREGQPLVLACLLVAIAVPRVLLGWLLAHFERSVVALRWMGYGLVGGAALSPLWRPAVDDDAPWLLPVLVSLVMLYLAAYFWIMSDPDVVRDPGSEA